MTAVVILNAVLAALVVTAILSVLGWGIVKDRQQRRPRHAQGGTLG